MILNKNNDNFFKLYMMNITHTTVPSVEDEENEAAQMFAAGAQHNPDFHKK